MIEEAKGHIGEQEENFEDVVADLEDTRRKAKEDQAEIEKERREAVRIRARLEERERKLQESREKILAAAREEAHELLRQTKEYADETIRRYNKLGGSADSSKEMERERTKLRETMNGLEKEMSPRSKEKPKKEVKARQLHIGDPVHVLSLNLRGIVSTLPDARGNLFVQMGILRSQVNIKDIELLEEEESSASSGKNTGTGEGSY